MGAPVPLSVLRAPPLVRPAYTSLNTANNQDWLNEIGKDFDVLAPITVTRLGAWDDSANGYSGSVSIGIFNRKTGALVPGLGPFTITGAHPRTGMYRMLELVQPVTLLPGQYSIVTQSNTERFRNNPANSTIKASTASIRFGGGRYSVTRTLVFPANTESNDYDSATFEFAEGYLAPATMPKLAVMAAFASAANSVTKSILPAGAAVTLTGKVPAITRTANQLLVPAEASLATAGQLPGVTRTAHQFLSPAGTSLGLTGNTPATASSTNQVTDPAGSSLACSGNAPLLQQTNHIMVAPSGASLVFSGFIGRVLQEISAKLQPLPASWQLTGNAPTLVRTDHRNLAPLAGQLTLAGSAPAVIHLRRVRLTGRRLRLRNRRCINNFV